MHRDKYQPYCVITMSNLQRIGEQWYNIIFVKYLQTILRINVSKDAQFIYITETEVIGRLAYVSMLAHTYNIKLLTHTHTHRLGQFI